MGHMCNGDLRQGYQEDCNLCDGAKKARDAKLWELFVARFGQGFSAEHAFDQARAALAVWEARNEEGK